MKVKTLKLRNFRNYEELDINISEGCNVIFGDNAQGKTNIIESIFLCATGRSHRTSHDHEMIRMGEKGYIIKLCFEKNRDDIEIEMRYFGEGKKLIFINEIPVRKMGSLIGNLNVVIFSPEDLMIIKEGPSMRRKFIDITISQLKPSYFYDLQQYAKVISQRNALLRDMKYRPSMENMLEIWNQQMIQVGVAIMKIRNDFIEKMSQRARLNHYGITKNKEKLDIQYKSSFYVEQWQDVESIRKEFEKALEKVKEREKMRGTTLVGPQRDDIDIFLDDMEIKQYGSQGQQRTAILSMKLSEIDIMKIETGENPILLLDDVMSELDVSRQEYLLRNLEEIQTFITCTDKENIEKVKGKHNQYFKIEKGKIIK